ncbi:MAG TPA: 16S rRNA (adenine(1518)-N(6)/adenine(1519)-N(6))-dimethyltransferase RsmA [Gemmatimonadaceae bacterium]|nr:16S rRNA (adenine(1518)-N(6)/adenine(1519)-N(6))-dimethyltransferase RsmA [Gemmatimonadaceae bacterium]
MKRDEGEAAERRPAAHRTPRARKRFGQHFLADPGVLERIVEALDPGPGATVVEIGPGRGALTDRLAARAARVIAVEIDRDLVALLRERYAEQGSVRVVEGDALKVDWAALAGGPYRLAGNLPYYITTPLLFRALQPPRPERSVVLVQREVADRIVAAPGSKTYGALSVNVQLVAHAEIVARVPAASFRPRPSVDSAVVRLLPRVHPLLSDDEAAPLRHFIQGIFGFRRKQMVRVLRELRGVDADAARRVLSAAAVAPDVRPETLPPDAFLRLFRALGAT